MKNKLKWLINSTILISISMLFSSCNQQKAPYLTIATAANMQFAMEELTTSFTNETGIKCETILSSSGKLTAQIKEGAPYDIFISANMKYPIELYNAGFTTQEPKIYALGKLVLWTMIDTLIPTIDLLFHKNIKHIATANPKTAPYGIPTEEVFNYYQLLDSIKHKLVYGENIAQTNQFITTKAAEIGFTAKSVVLSPFIKGKGIWIDIDERAYSPIKQGIVIIKNTSTSIDKKEKFYNFLFSKNGQEILNKYGYSTNF